MDKRIMPPGVVSWCNKVFNIFPKTFKQQLLKPFLTTFDGDLLFDHPLTEVGASGSTYTFCWSNNSSDGEDACLRSPTFSPDANWRDSRLRPVHFFAWRVRSSGARCSPCNMLWGTCLTLRPVVTYAMDAGAKKARGGVVKTVSTTSLSTRITRCATLVVIALSPQRMPAHIKKQFSSPFLCWRPAVRAFARLPYGGPRSSGRHCPQRAGCCWLLGSVVVLLAHDKAICTELAGLEAEFPFFESTEFLRGGQTTCLFVSALDGLCKGFSESHADMTYCSALILRFGLKSNYRRYRRY